LTDKAINSRSPIVSPRNSNAPSVNSDDGGLGKPGHGAISVLLAATWDDSVDPNGYYISEKLDGMRMVWTGTTMYSRNGNIIKFPKFFVEGWPKAQLDGEVYI
jgi:DNA ligase-1